MLHKLPSMIQPNFAEDIKIAQFYRENIFKKEPKQDESKCKDDNNFNDNLTHKTNIKNKVHFIIEKKAEHQIISNYSIDDSFGGKSNQKKFFHFNDSKASKIDFESELNKKRLMFSSALGNLSSDANKTNTSLLNNSTTPFTFFNIEENTTNNSVQKNNNFNDLVIQSAYKGNTLDKRDI